MFEPVLRKLKALRGVRDLVDDLHELTQLDAVLLRVGFQELIVADLLPQVPDGIADVPPRQSAQLHGKPVEPVFHPALAFPEIPAGDDGKVRSTVMESGFLSHRVPADIAVRPVHDAHQVRPVPDTPCQSQVGLHVFRDPVVHQVRQHLFHPEGNALRHQLRGQKPGLQIRSVENGNVAVMQARRVFRAGFSGNLFRADSEDPRFDLPGDIRRLLCRVRANHRVDRFSRRPGSPDLLFKAAPVVADQPPRRVDDLRRGAEIDVQQHLFCPGIIPLKSQHDLRLRAAEAVYRLVVIAHDGQVFPFSGDHPYDLILKAVDILELVHQDPLPALLAGAADIGAVPKQLISHEEHVFIVDLTEFPEGPLIIPEQVPESGSRTADRIVVVQIRPLFLYQRDLLLKIQRKGADIVRVDAVLPDQVRHDLHALLIPGDLLRGIAVGRPQKAEKEGVEGAEGHAAAPGKCRAGIPRRRRCGSALPRSVRSFRSGSRCKKGKIPLFHASRRSPGKGDHQDLRGPDAQGLRQIADPVRDDKGLAGTGARDYKKRSLSPGDRFFLCI